MSVYEAHNILIKKYDHEINFQRSMLGDIRKFISSHNYNTEQHEIMLNYYTEYTSQIFQLYAYDYEKLTGKLLCYY